MNRRWISLILILAMLFSLTVPAFAETPAATSGSVVNPLYVNYPAPDDNDVAAGRRLARSASAGGSADASVQAAAYVSPETAANQLRKAMMNRQSTVDLYISVPDFWSATSTNNWFCVDFFPMAYSDRLSTGPYDGDYLRWSWAGYDWHLIAGDGDQYTFRVNLRYYTTLQQERTLQSRVTALQTELGLGKLSGEAAYAAIYDYITSHVSYDNEGLAAIYDSSQSGKDYLIFTAYGAEVNGRAVCQGYAALFYALCKKAGLPVRIVTSTNHAWNIVKLNGKWYNVDATWDSSTASGREWYLLGSDHFSGGMHTATAEYSALSFQSAHPISAADYVPGSEPEQDSPFYTDVPQGRWSYDSIQAATRLGLMQGTGNGKFDPQMEVSRGMLVTVLWRMEGSPECSSAGFSDVASGRYFAKAVDWAAANGIVLGVGNNRFAPDMIATREQTVTILYRYLQYLHKDVSAQDSLSRFTDAGAVSNFAKTPMRWAVAKGLMNGTSSHSLSPKDSITREQMTTLIVRAISTYGL